MIDELIAGIVLFKNFILLTLAAGIIGSLLAVIGTRKFSWNGRARGVYGFLINRSDREAVCFVVSLRVPVRPLVRDLPGRDGAAASGFPFSLRRQKQSPEAADAYS